MRPLLILLLLASATPLLAQDAPASPTPTPPPKVTPEWSLSGGPARFEGAYLTERFATRFQAAFERALGRKLEKRIEFLITDGTGMKALVEAESKPLGAKLTDVSPEEFLKQSSALAKTVLGKIRASDGKIVINPEAFAVFAKLYDPNCAGQAFLDAVLIHEAVHAAQHQVRPLATFLGGQTTVASLRSRMSVVEGHAQLVARATAAALELTPSFELLVKVATELPEKIPEAKRAELKVLLAEITIPYVQGEGFMRALAKSEGSVAKAEARAFEQPPTTLREVKRPGEYLNPPQARVEVRPLVARMARELGMPELTSSQIKEISEAQLRAALALADADLLERCIGQLNASVLLVSGNGRGQQVVMVVSHFSSVQGAKDLLTVERQVLDQKDKDFSRPDSPYKLTSVRQEKSPFKGMDGFASARTAIAQGAEVKVYTVVVQFGNYCVEAFEVNIENGKSKLLGFLERALPVLGAKAERAKGDLSVPPAKSEEPGSTPAKQD